MSRPPTTQPPADPSKRILGQRLLNHRHRKGLTLRQVGRAIGFSAQSVSCWERGLNEPSIGTLEKLADLFEVETAALVSGPSDVATLADRAGQLTQAVESVDNLAPAPRLNHHPVPPRGLLRVPEIHEFDIAGDAQTLTDLAPIYEWHLPQHLFTHVTGDVRILRITTDALAPLIAPNDYVLIDISQRQVWGTRGVYIFSDGNLPAVRKIVPVRLVDNSPPTIRIFCPSRNVEEKVVDLSSITILGRVIGKLTMWL